MRGDAEAHRMVAPGTLASVLELIAGEPGEWTPIAGGTELMVAHAAGRLPSSKLVSLWGIPELRFIDTRPERLAIGAGSTFTDLRANLRLTNDFSLLARAAARQKCLLQRMHFAFAGKALNGLNPRTLDL